jgi:hypothetical protein
MDNGIEQRRGTALEIVLATEMTRTGDSYTSLARKAAELSGRSVSRQAFGKRVKKTVPTVETVDLVAQIVGLDRDDILKKMGAEVAAAAASGRSLPGGGQVSGAFVPSA